MVELQYLDKYIEERLLADNAERERNHTPSGKLSASMLGSPLQHQILKVIGVPQEPLDEYTIRKFKRGNHVEDWLIDYIPGLINKQKFVEYRGVVGYVDAIVDMRDWKLDLEVIPHEIKSVANAKFKRIKRNGADDGHALQACLYALALHADQFAIDYVASDDYRVKTILLDVHYYEEKVNNIIDAFDAQRKSGFVPEFVSRYSWRENPQYNKYSRFINMGPIEIDQVLQTEYPESYKKLKGLK